MTDARIEDPREWAIREARARVVEAAKAWIASDPVAAEQYAPDVLDAVAELERLEAEAGS